MQMTLLQNLFLQRTDKKAAKAYNIMCSSAIFVSFYITLGKCMFLLKFNLTDFFCCCVAYSITFQLDKLMKMSYNKNYR